jgi:RecB family exonuclease
MLERFAQYHRTATRDVEGVEIEFTFKLGRAVVSGSIDRLEVDSDGKFFVVDFKTGKAIGKKEAAENLQLACYQLAVILNGFEKKFESPSVSGSHLVFLGHDTKDVATRERPPIDVPVISANLEKIADEMASPIFIAKKNDFCTFCPVKSSCPVHLQGRSVIG